VPGPSLPGRATARPSYDANPSPSPVPMLRILLILAIGAVLGYGYGFRDAQVHEKMLATRVLERLGGDARDYSSNDVDGMMTRAER